MGHIGKEDSKEGKEGSKDGGKDNSTDAVLTIDMHHQSKVKQILPMGEYLVNSLHNPCNVFQFDK
jgi:hypothetical protein